MPKKKTKYPSYRYFKAQSILNGLSDEYVLSKDEYGLLYEFFVTYSLCKGQSVRYRTFRDYGWNESITKSGLKQRLSTILELDKNPQFVFLDNKDNTSKKIASKFKAVKLENGALLNFDYEHGVIGRTQAGNHYTKLFYRIRNGFAHGKYILKFNDNGEKVIIIQDDGNNSVSARIIIKLDTLLNIIKTIDRNHILAFNPKEEK